MRATPHAELKPKKPFASLEEEVFQSTLRTADYLLWGEIEVLRAEDLTFPQYNVLRILRGAGPEGVSCREISERMVTRDSDITRLLDRLEARDLVARVRDTKDRRVIVPRITQKGLDLLKGLDGPISGLQANQLKHMTRTQLKTLAELLQQVRHAGS